jgi:hypothetical protein
VRGGRYGRLICLKEARFEKTIANWCDCAQACLHVRKISLLFAQGFRAMTERSRRETVHFRHPFQIRGIDRVLPAGAYEVITDEEMIEGISFPCFRRVATRIMVPGASPHRSAVEMISISSIDLANALHIDASAPRE